MTLAVQLLTGSAARGQEGRGDAATASPARILGGARSAGAPINSKRPYTIDDLLKREAIGKSMSDPGGRWIVWEQTPPYDELSDYSVGRINSFGIAGARLMILDTQMPDAVPEPIIDADGADSHWLDSFSPEGRYLAYYRTSKGAYSMGVFDFVKRKALAFDAAPDLDFAGHHRSVWISPHEFVFSAVPPGDEPIEALRQSSGKSLWRDWNAAWRGELSVSELASHTSSGNEKPIAGRLVKVDALTGKMSILADGLFNSLTISPDGRYLAGLRQFPRVQAAPGVANLDWTTSRSALQIFDLVKGTNFAVAANKDVLPRTLEWAPDRDRLAFFSWNLGAGVRSGMFQSFDAASGKLTPMPHNGLDLVSERERGMYQKPERAMWIGGRLAVLARAYGNAGEPPRFTYRGIASAGLVDKPGRADWFLLGENGHHVNLTKSLDEPAPLPLGADGRSLTVLAGGQVWRLGLGKEPTTLLHKSDEKFELPPNKRYETDHPPFVRFVTLVGRRSTGWAAASLDIRTGKVHQTQFPSASSRLLTMAGQSGVALFQTTSAKGVALIARRDNEQARDLAWLNAYLAGIEHTAFSVVHYAVNTAQGKRNVDACMILPAGYQKGRRYPVIVDIYPGIGAGACSSSNSTDTSSLGNSGTIDPHLLAAHGYIVLRPNTSRFLTNRPPNPLAGMADAVDAALDALIAQGYADPDRIGMIGVSQGGYASLWLATQMKRLKAVVSINGWSDMYSHRFDGIFAQRYYSDRLGSRGESTRYEPSGDKADFGTGVKVWDQPDAYVRNSPLFNAQDVTAPVMLIHSDMDSFNINQYDMMFTALYEQKKEARFLRYAGEGHGPSSPANIRHMWSSIFDWFDRYIRPAESEGHNKTSRH